MRRDLSIAAILFVVCVVVFSPVYNAQFIHWDDDLNITGNPHILGLNSENLKWMFTDFSFMRRYVPMSWLTWATTAQIFGLNPRAFHIEGLLLHSINAVLLFFLLKEILLLTRKSADGTTTTIAAGLGALVWALHPLRVEVVAWANCQMYAQSLLLLFVSTFIYLRAATSTKDNSTSILLSAFFFLLSLLTYPTAIAFVAVLLVLDVFLLRRLPVDIRLWKNDDTRRVLVEKIPFVIATLFVAGITLWARSHLTDFWKTTDRLSDFGWPSRLGQAFYIWAYYAWKPWFSLNWSPVYTQLVSFHITDWPFVLSTLGVAGVSMWLVGRRKRSPWALALWICHLALLVPMLGLTEHPHYPNDRYNYLAAIAWSVGLALLVQTVRKSKAIVAIGLFACCAFAVFSFQQTKIWRDSYTLFSATINKLGNDPYRADLYWRLGKTFASENKTEEAADSFKKSLAIAPGSAPVHLSLAELYFAQKQTNAAISEYELAAKANPHHPLAQYNLALLFDQQGKTAEAIPHFRAAIENDPKNVDAYNGLSRTLAKTGAMDEALKVLQQTLELDPTNAYANFNLGNALMQRQNIPQALEHFTIAIKSKPDLADAHYQLGTCLAMMGRVADALPHFADCARLKPNFAPGLLSLGMASAQTGNFEGAVEAYRGALRADPDFLQAVINLGWILASHQDARFRNGSEALKLAEHAAALTHEQDPEAFDLEAAAYAECKKFPEAAAAVSKAIALVNQGGSQNRAAQLQARLDLYRSERPLRQ